jgi:haloacetate dehalogenase
MYSSFVHEEIAVDGAKVALVRGGTGQPLLLLHGFPETRAAWHRVAPTLAERFTLVIPDLPGYGDSIGTQYSKRAMARTLVSVMRALGHEEFAVAGHDRGGRVAYRMALDHAGAVSHLAVLDIVPTLEMVRDLTPQRASLLFNWFFLAQPAPLPETLIGRAPAFYLNRILDGWVGEGASLAPEARAEYARCFGKPEVLHAICEEYRAALGADLEHDRADQASGRRIRCPVLALWSEHDLAGEWFDVLGVWRRWARTVSGRSLSCGHFLMEEAPAEVAAQLQDFLHQPALQA